VSDAFGFDLVMKQILLASEKSKRDVVRNLAELHLAGVRLT
jgi:hypothetical protein